MSRKYRSTETNGTCNLDIGNGQNFKSRMFCSSCNGLNKHYNNCIDKKEHRIPTVAEVPRKSASKRIWDIFKKQFVFVTYKNFHP